MALSQSKRSSTSPTGPVNIKAETRPTCLLDLIGSFLNTSCLDMQKFLWWFFNFDFWGGITKYFPHIVRHYLLISCLILMNLYMFMIEIWVIYCDPPWKIWTPKNFTTANFRHSVSNSWLRHCLTNHLLGHGWSVNCPFWHTRLLNVVGIRVWSR